MTAGRVLLGVAGVGSLTGVGAADAIRRIGARATFLICALTAAATALLASLPWSLPAVIASAFSFGVSYNIAAAVSVLALTRLHPDRPASAVAVIAGANATGLMFAPPAGAALSTQIGLPTTLILAAIILAISTFGAPPNHP